MLDAANATPSSESSKTTLASSVSAVNSIAQQSENGNAHRQISKRLGAGWRRRRIQGDDTAYETSLASVELVNKMSLFRRRKQSVHNRRPPTKQTHLLIIVYFKPMAIATLQRQISKCFRVFGRGRYAAMAGGKVVAWSDLRPSNYVDGK